VEAAEGTEALRKIRRHPPDLIVCDLMLPGLSGSELLRTLKADPKRADIPFILITNRISEALKVQMLDKASSNEPQDLKKELVTTLASTKFRHFMATFVLSRDTDPTFSIGGNTWIWCTYYSSSSGLRGMAYGMCICMLSAECYHSSTTMTIQIMSDGDVCTFIK